MDKVLLLHGWGGNSEENWLPWLKNELEKKFFADVYVPNLPNTNLPNIEQQEEYIDIYASDFKLGGLIVGHSLGGQLAINFLQENNIKNSLIILVAPTYPGLALELGKGILKNSFNTLEKYYDTKIDFEKVNKFNNKFIVFLSNNDPYINKENAKKYYKKLNNIEFVEFKDKGHFNKDAGILELEEILKYL